MTRGYNVACQSQRPKQLNNQASIMEFNNTSTEFFLYVLLKRFGADCENHPNHVLHWHRSSGLRYDTKCIQETGEVRKGSHQHVLWDDAACVC